MDGSGDSSEKNQVLSKIVQIMDYVVHMDSSKFSMQQMSQDLQIPRGTLYRLIDALVEERLLIRQQKGFHIGLKVFEWTVELLNQPDVVGLAHPFLQSLALESGLTASLYLRMNEYRVCLDRVESAATLRPTVRIGEALPLHVGAPGLVLLAWLPAEQRQLYLAQSRAQFPHYEQHADDSMFSRVRQQGWALSLGERDEHMASLSAPVFSATGDVAAAIALSGIRHQFRAETHIDNWREMLVTTTVNISRLLGSQN
ncbi:IclR family transcriptional regulator [Alicyclobacillus dauci]|uniref:IclR family transcriptional regulator n=1 Tax=Alicyclobacillus dauci TaxID=1475485 RepID=A0ABY6Z233_9BACL|nr:IclR family transcriptional regulator [Alicyclobacillus dauci]WAH36805.1 IclR family transcriptional regulator [Alicyclobacillus dauci]